MADKILIEVVSQADGLDETNEKMQQLTQREKELLSEMNNLTKQKQQWQSSAQVVAAFDKEIEKTNTELKSTRKSMEDLSKATKEMPGKVVAEQAEQSFRTLRREIEEQIKALRLAGKTGTEEYQKLVKEAGRLADIQGDVSREIKNLASDTSTFDAILGGTQLIAGGFSVAQGAAALFGAEQEDLQKMMVKLQSVIAITTGLQQIQNAVQKESAVVMGLQNVGAAASTITMKLLGAATATTTLQFKLLRGAIIATGIGALAVGVGILISHWEDLVSWFKKGTDGISGFGKAFDKVKEIAMGVYETIKTYILAPFKTIGKIISGDFKGAFEEMKKGFDVVGNYQKGANEQMLKNQQDSLQKRIIASKRAQSEELLVESEKLQKTLEVDKARGMSAEDLYKREMEILNKKIAGYNLALETISDKNSEKAKEYMKLLDDLEQQSAVKTAANDKRIEDEAKAAREKAAAAAKAAYEKAKQELEKRDAEIIKIERDLQDAKLAAMKDGEEKEISSIKQSLERRLAEIKGESDAEIELRKQLEENTQKEIEKVQNKYNVDRQKSEIETEVAIINARLAETVRGSNEELDLRQQLLNEKAKLDIVGVNASIDSEELKAAKILEINANLNKDLKDLSAEYIQTADERSKAEVLAVTQSYEQGKISRSKYEKQLSDISIKSLEDEIDERKAKGQDTVDLEKELSEKRIAIAEEETERRKQLFQELFNAMSDIGNSFFDMQKQGLDQQMEDLQHYYTTDAEAAKKNKDLKLISEDEMNRRQLEIKRKQAKVEKDQALFNAYLSMAQGIAKALSSAAPPYNLILAAITGAASLIQIAAINSRPLPKYWKGRKGGKGEYALIGEYGPEIAWLPAGASLMPAHDTRRALMGDEKTFERWNMPKIEPDYPAMPRVNQQLINQYYQTHRNEERIDYDLLGKSVAKYMKFPKYQKQKDVTINFDKSGLSVTEGNTTTHVLNTKYNRQ